MLTAIRLYSKSLIYCLILPVLVRLRLRIGDVSEDRLLPREFTLPTRCPLGMLTRHLAEVLPRVQAGHANWDVRGLPIPLPGMCSTMRPTRPYQRLTSMSGLQVGYGRPWSGRPCLCIRGERFGYGEMIGALGREYGLYPEELERRYRRCRRVYDQAKKQAELSVKALSMAGDS
jgi:hypothetical protein